MFGDQGKDVEVGSAQTEAPVVRMAIGRFEIGTLCGLVT